MATRKLLVGREFAGKNLDVFLSRAVPGLSLDRARALLAAGHVRIRGKVARASRKLWGNEEIELEAPPPAAVRRVEGAPISALYEDDGLLVIDKPAGHPVEPEPGQVSVVELVATQYRGFDVGGLAQPGVAHRLDKDTTGCLALAKTDDALAALKAAFEQKRVRKVYTALVLGLPPPGAHRLEGPYGRDPANPRKYTTRYPSARRAALTFRATQVFPAHAVAQVEVELETGRTHQIRVQLSEANHPLLGDTLYGTEPARSHPAAKVLGRIALHAATLQIEGLGRDGRIQVTAPLPADFERALETLRSA